MQNSFALDAWHQFLPWVWNNGSIVPPSKISTNQPLQAVARTANFHVQRNNLYGCIWKKNSYRFYQTDFKMSYSECCFVTYWLCITNSAVKWATLLLVNICFKWKYPTACQSVSVQWLLSSTHPPSHRCLWRQQILQALPPSHQRLLAPPPEDTSSETSWTSSQTPAVLQRKSKVTSRRFPASCLTTVDIYTD